MHYLIAYSRRSGPLAVSNPNEAAIGLCSSERHHATHLPQRQKIVKKTAENFRRKKFKKVQNRC
jgi:hypothetical protein